VRLRLRRRLALYGATVTALAMLGFGIALIALAGAAAPADQERALTTLATESAAALAEAPTELFADVVPLLAADGAATSDQFVMVVSEAGEVVFSTGTMDGEVPQVPLFLIVEARETGSATEVIDAGGVELRLSAVPFDRADAPAVTGAVVAAQSTAFIEEQLAGIVGVVVFAAVVALLVAAVVGWLISRRALRPLHGLAETTDEIGRTGDLERRLDPVATDDEVGRLTTSFNEMLDRIAQTRAQLEQSLDSQRRFVADASHELRSPLTTIRNNAGFLIGHPDAADRDRTDAIADISAEAERMASLVDDLLELAGADARPQRPQRPVSLASVAEATARRAVRHGVALTTNIDGDPTVNGNLDAIARLVWILVENSATHGRSAVELTISSENGGATIEVLDRGPGIPEVELAQVFERFYRSDPARSPSGSGLGLAIAASITHRHDGSLTLRNRDGGGLVATVTLPA